MSPGGGQVAPFLVGDEEEEYLDGDEVSQYGEEDAEEELVDEDDGGEEDNSVDEDEEELEEEVGCADHPSEEEEVSSDEADEEEEEELMSEDGGEEADEEEEVNFFEDEEDDDEACEDYPVLGEVKAAEEVKAEVSEPARKRMREEKDGAVWEYEADCPVCLEPWTEEGPHQSCSLKCGHTFGRSCIEEWVLDWNKKQCPKCKKRCKISDIRPIYPKRVAVVENALQKELDILRAEKILLEEEVNNKTAMLESANLKIESVRKGTASCAKRMDDICAYHREQFQILHDRVWVLHTNCIGPTERYIVPPLLSPERFSP